MPSHPSSKRLLNGWMGIALAHVHQSPGGTGGTEGRRRCWVEWPRLVILALRRWKQEACRKLKATPVLLACSSLARTTQQELGLERPDSNSSNDRKKWTDKALPDLRWGHLFREAERRTEKGRKKEEDSFLSLGIMVSFLKKPSRKQNNRLGRG